MKKILIYLLMTSILVSADINPDTETEVGRYQLETTSYMSKKGTIYIVETVLDTKTGKVVTRRKKKASRYKLPYKDRYNKMVTSE